MFVFILVLTAFPSAPNHMHKPVRVQPLAYETSLACRQEGDRLRHLVASGPGVRYVDARCFAIRVERAGKEDS